MEKRGVFKSPEGRDLIRGYYNNVLNRFPLKQLYLDTSYGKTFVLRAGSADGRPLILLHGSCSNSSAWLGDIARLSESYFVYSVDIPGEPGNSEDKRLDFHSDDYPHWLNEVMDGLCIKRAAIVGNSLGGWLALSFAALFPQRVSALALMAPSGIVTPKQSFIDQTSDMASHPEKAEAARDSLLSVPGIPKEVLEFMALVMENFNPFTGALPVLSDQNLMKLDMPVLLIAGKDDITMDANLAAARLLEFLPQARIHLIEGPHVILGVTDVLKGFLDTVMK